MPLKRSPPVKKTAHTSDTSRTVSESTDRSETPSTKRKHNLVEKSPNKDEIEDLKMMFENYKKQQDIKHKALQQKLSEFQQEHKQSLSSLEFLHKEYDDLKGQFIKIQREKVEDSAYIQTLEEKVAGLEKTSRSSGLEIRNIPVQKTETKEELSEYIINIGKAINEPIQMSDIRDVFRTNSKAASSKPIIVDFASTIKKEKVLKSIKTFNRERRDSKLNSSHLRIAGPAKPIFVSESMSLKVKRLFSLARDFAKTNGYTFCWVTHSQIYLRKKEGVPSVRITAEADFQKILEQR